MRAALWLLAIFAGAVGLALFAGENPGTITLFWPPHRVDVSLNLAVVVALIAFAVFYLAMRAVSALLQLPRQAKAWRQQQRERAMHSALRDALGHLLAGRFSRARKLADSAVLYASALAGASKGADSASHAVEVRALAHLVCAESAQSLQDSSGRDAQLRLALDAPLPSAARHLREAMLLRAARWALDDRDPQAALSRLSLLSQGAQRRTLALRIHLRAARLARQTHSALDTARLLAKHGAFPKAAAQSLVRNLVISVLGEAHDAEQLIAVWSLLTDADKAQSEIATHAAQRLVNLAQDPLDAPIHQATARSWLQATWEGYAQLSEPMKTRLVRTLEASFDSIDTPWLARIESAQQRLPGDGRLQYLAGMACLKRQLWGKAQQMLTLASRDLTDDGLKRSAWRALALLAENRGDASAASAAWRSAAGN